MQTKREVLKKYFGYETFRAGQEEVIDSLLSKRDSLCIMPTGSGKSICYQIPALMFEGVTIVVSPLISLMKDQVQALVNVGVNAAYINSSLSFEVAEKVLKRIAAAQYKIVYVAPERLLTEKFMRAVGSLEISFLVVDEVHCISKWGHDFRPGYLDIVKFIGKLPERPVIGAFTATATENVKQDVIELLNLQDPLVKTTTFDRSNLYLEVRRPKNKEKELLDILASKRGESGVIYCATRKTVEEVYSFITQKGYSATKYHAGMEDIERGINQEDFVYDRKAVMVATNAFGMGIDKGNVSFVIHYNMPKDMESYYQEAGRAGRDGNRAECILLFAEGDIYTNRFLIDHSEKNGQQRENEIKLLYKMADYCKTEKCLRGYILGYFGEEHPLQCDNCSNCLDKDYEYKDVTEEADIILECVKHLPRKYGKAMIVSVLKGSAEKKIVENLLFKVPEYGKLKQFSRYDIEKIIDQMITAGLIEKQGTEYPVLALARKDKPIDQSICVKVHAKKSVPSNLNAEQTIDLFDRLKKLRLEISRRENIPAYVVFSDATLKDMCIKKPSSREDFLEVAGVGEVKCDRYGAEFMAEIKKFTDEVSE